MTDIPSFSPIPTMLSEGLFLRCHAKSLDCSLALQNPFGLNLVLGTMKKIYMYEMNFVLMKVSSGLVVS